MKRYDFIYDGHSHIKKDNDNGEWVTYKDAIIYGKVRYAKGYSDACARALETVEILIEKTKNNLSENEEQE